jgi:hypothetical protein
MSYYGRGNYPKVCKTQYTTSYLNLTDSTGYLVEFEALDTYDFYNIHNKTLPQGKYTLQVETYWGDYDVRDYTVRIYAKSKINITQTSPINPHIEEPRLEDLQITM